jgi:Uncharacterised protein family (UPF0236)
MATSKKPSQDPDREARIQRILRQVEKQLREELPDPHQPLEQIEREVVDLGEKIRDVIERETLAPLGHGYAGSQTPCACGRPARFVAIQPRQLVTLNGSRRLRRAYYYCATCQKGFAPLDQQLRIGRGESSVGVRALTARFASYLPFEKAAEELALVCGIRLAARTVQREAESVGEAIAATWQAREQQLWAGKAEPPAARPTCLQITMDGVMLPVGREWKEVKVGCVYTPRAGGGVEQAAYVATLSDSVAFGRRLSTLAYGTGVDYCRKTAVVGDGAEWIWQEAAKHFPRCVEILDFYHVSQYLWELARSRYPQEEAAEGWVREQQERLLQNGVADVIAAIDGWEAATEEEAEVKRRVGNYLRVHAHRMAYETYREQGYHIGSGVAEASCKQVVQARLKGAGMRWGKAGAEAMLQLRAVWCTTGSTDFRAAARRATLPSGS